jgi:polyhydroxyalkanoate synthesis regulator phasin
MAKKDDKGKAGDARSRAEQVRAAVEGAFGATAQGAGPVRERAQELADELVGAAARFREVLEELRPPTLDELTTLRNRVAALESRVAELETQAAGAAAKPARARATRPTAKGAKGASASPGASTARRGAAAKRRAAGTDESA